jgi:hypothetical protein
MSNSTQESGTKARPKSKFKIGSWTTRVKGLTLLVGAVVTLIATTLYGISKIRKAYQTSSTSLAGQQGVIIGEIRALASSTLPDGWLEANGGSYQNSKLSALHEAYRINVGKRGHELLQCSRSPWAIPKGLEPRPAKAQPCGRPCIFRRPRRRPTSGTKSCRQHTNIYFPEA